MATVAEALLHIVAIVLERSASTAPSRRHAASARRSHEFPYLHLVESRFCRRRLREKLCEVPGEL